MKNNAEYAFDVLRDAPGLQPTMPQGAMYMLVGIDPDAFQDIENDKDFFTKLICEESISCLPASVRKSIFFFKINS